MWDMLWVSGDGGGVEGRLIRLTAEERGKGRKWGLLISAVNASTFNMDLIA